MFWMLVPAVAVFAESLSALFFAADERMLTHVLFISAFGYVLLGSMTLNAWLALRHPDSLYQRELPRALSIVYACLYLVEVLWLTQGFIVTHINRSDSGFDGWMLALTLPLMGLSIAAFVLIVRRDRPQRVDRVDAVRLTRPGAAVAVTAVALSAATVAAYLLLRTAETDGFWSFALMLPGLPWSHPLYFASIWLLVPSRVIPAEVLTSVLLAPIGVNVAITIALTASTPLRTRFVNWFFRLGRT